MLGRNRLLPKVGYCANVGFKIENDSRISDYSTSRSWPVLSGWLESVYPIRFLFFYLAM